MFRLFKKKNSEPKPEPEFRRATLPPRRNEAIPINPVSHIHDDDISQAVALFRAHPGATNLNLYTKLAALGMPRGVAARMVEFLPLVYGRLSLSKTEVQFSQTFQRVLPDGTLSPKRNLADEPLWLAAAQFARSEVDRGVSQSDIGLLANRSSEIEVVEQAKKKGSDLLMLSSPMFCWPEEGPQE